MRPRMFQNRHSLMNSASHKPHTASTALFLFGAVFTLGRPNDRLLAHTLPVCSLCHSRGCILSLFQPTFECMDKSRPSPQDYPTRRGLRVFVARIYTPRPSWESRYTSYMSKNAPVLVICRIAVSQPPGHRLPRLLFILSPYVLEFWANLQRQPQSLSPTLQRKLSLHPSSCDHTIARSDHVIYKASIPSSSISLG